MPPTPSMYAARLKATSSSPSTYANRSLPPLPSPPLPYIPSHLILNQPPINQPTTHSLSLALPVGPCSSSPAASPSTTSSPAITANSAFCSVDLSSVLRGSTSSKGFSFALLRILSFLPARVDCQLGGRPVQRVPYTTLPLSLPCSCRTNLHSPTDLSNPQARKSRGRSSEKRSSSSGGK